MISIKGLTIPQVVHALYINTSAVGFGKQHDKPDVTVEEVEDFLKTYGAQDTKFLDLDYLWGRPLKVTIDKENMTLDRADLYDRDSKVPAEVVISRLLKKS